MKKVIAIVVAVVVFGGALVAAAYFVYEGFLNPEAEVKRMVGAMQEVETVKFDLTADIADYESDLATLFEDGPEDFSISAAGDISKRSENKYDFAIKVELDEAGNSGTKMSAEFRKIKEDLFIKLIEADELTDMFGEVQGTWIEFEMEDVEGFTGDMTGDDRAVSMCYISKWSSMHKAR